MSYPETLSELTNYPKALSHAESGGGGGALKPVTITNTADSNITVYNVVYNGVLYGDENEAWDDATNFLKIGGGETIEAYYLEPAEGFAWYINGRQGTIIEGEGIETFPDFQNSVAILPNAQNVSITLRKSGGGTN